MLTLPQAGAYRSNIPSLEDNRGKEALANHWSEHGSGNLFHHQ